MKGSAYVIRDTQSGLQRRSRRRGAVTALLAAGALLLIGVADAAALPVWRIDAAANSTVAPGGTTDFYISAINVGDEPTDGITSDTVTVTLPSGLTGTSVNDPFGAWSCSDPVGASVITCTTTDVQDPGSSVPPLAVTAQADSATSGLRTASFEISGGGAAASALTAQSITVTAAPSSFGIEGFDGRVSRDAAGDADTQAADHPYAIQTSIALTTATDPVFGPVWPVEPAKDLSVDLPPGLVGDPTNAQQCTMSDLAAPTGDRCPVDSQVGVADLTVGLGNPSGGAPQVFSGIPVHSMVAPPNVPARFGFNVASTVVTLDARVRSGGDYGLTVDANHLSEGLALIRSQLTFWGVPSDPSHDAQRSCPAANPEDPTVTGCSSTAPRRAFLRNPTSCQAAGTGLVTRLRADSWFHPGAFVQASFASHLPPGYPLAPEAWGAVQGPTGCDLVPFDPAFAAEPGTPAKAGEPSGFSFDLAIPQSDDPDTLAESDLKKVVVTLPKGVRVSPSSATGLEACNPAQIALHSDADPTCPDASKIGSLRIDTPLLADPLTGGVFLAKPHDNPFGTLLAIYFVAKGPGVVVKLPGRISADPATGQLAATFDDNPQLPFSNFHAEFKGGPRAPLVNPASCGTHTTRAVLTSWSGSVVTVDSRFAVSRDGHGAPCPQPGFRPDFSTGTRNPVAGASTSFLLSLSRDDQDQELRSVIVQPPEGLLARIKRVPLCPAAAAARGTCAATSRIGSVSVGAGAGPTPFFLPGRVYMSGPYKGAPFSLSIVVPAIAGPFDLGTVVVRSAIFINRETAALRIVSDPLPTILQGIPLQVRVVRVRIDRPHFIINPTSCRAQQVLGTIASTRGAIAHAHSRFQVGECAELPLRPQLTLRVGAKGHTGHHASTPLVATLRQTPGQSALRSVAVTLPSALSAQLDVVGRACTLVQFHAGNCASARAGSAVAVTPLLKRPLRGGIYFVKDPNRPAGSLPNLVVALRGQVAVDLKAHIRIPGGTLLATQFAQVPDVPITRFTLRFVSGRNGPLKVAENLCGPSARGAAARVSFVGQNGKRLTRRQRLVVEGCTRRGHR